MSLPLSVQIGPDELIIATNVGDHAVRRRSYKLLAKLFGLAERTNPPRSLPEQLG